jgi:hypothetical protein
MEKISCLKNLQLFSNTFLPACLRNQEHAVTIAYNNKNLQTSHQIASWHIRARICKRVRNPGIEESTPPAHVAWRAGTTNRVVGPALQAGNRFLGLLKGLQIRPQLMSQPIAREKTYSFILFPARAAMVISPPPPPPPGQAVGLN